MSSDKHLRCSFCGKSKETVKKFISGPSVYICNECISLCNEILAEEEDRESSESAVPSPVPQEIKEILDQYVIGQEGAKRALAVAVYNHYKRVNNQGVLDEVEIDKANILLIGPTGVGKTLLAQTLARILHVPFTIADATTLTEAGYVGEDVEKHPCSLAPGRRFQRGRVRTRNRLHRRNGQDRPEIRKPVDHAGTSRERASNRRSSRSSKGRSHRSRPRGVGNIRNRSTSNSTPRNILFVCGGAFDGLEQIIESRLGRRRIGFGEKASEEERDELLPYVEPEDLQRFGLIPELVGRLPVVVHLTDLDEDSLVRILEEPKKRAGQTVP